MALSRQPPHARLAWSATAAGLVLLSGATAVCQNSGDNMDGLRGEYGFLTEFSGFSEYEARRRVRDMVQTFNICEFQFYDAHPSYSGDPPMGMSWPAVVSGRLVQRSIIQAYISEIASLGGRSWLYVQAMATSPGDVAMEQAALARGSGKVGTKMVNGKPLLDIMRPSAGWAELIAPKWASLAKDFSFSGIHWDSLASSSSPTMQLPAFLRVSQGVLAAQGLGQTANFVDGAQWDSSLWTQKYIAFPYWEVWTVPAVEDMFFQQVAPHGGAVFVCYPGHNAEHIAEGQNANAVGTWPLDLLILRWKKARAFGNTYLVIGDGRKYLQDEYFPHTSLISAEDAQKIVRNVFGQV